MLLTPDEIDFLIARELPVTDERRAAWEALPPADPGEEGDREAVARRATADFDAVTWTGRPSDSDQEHAWPRAWPNGATILPAGEMDPPDDEDEWSVAALPRDVRRALAIHAGRCALRARGYDQTRQAQEMAAAGVTSRGGGGRSVSIDRAAATNPWAAIDADAQRMVAKYRAAGTYLA